MRVAILLLISLGVVGCGDECHEGESECDGTQIRECDVSDGGFRGLGDCCAGSTCRDVISGGDHVAVCSDSPELDPRCSTFGIVCADATTLLECSYGYSRTIESCTGACVDPGDGHAFCAQVAADSRCVGVPLYGTTCAENMLLTCDDGARLDQTACAAACIDLGSGSAFCSTSAMPDPRCTSTVAWCDGNVAMTCTTGGYVDVETCAATETCTVPTLPDGTVLAAFCNAPATPNACAADQ